MFNLQEWIHKLEVGEGTRYMKLAAAVLGLLALTAVYDIREFKNFSTQEAMDSAQLARNIAEGRGYTTFFIRPLSVLLLQRQKPPGIPVLKDDQPDISNPPVYPFVLAGLMKVLPFNYEIKTVYEALEPEVLIAMFNQLLFFGAIWLVFRLAMRLFDAAVAWCSAIIFGAADLLWRFSVSGLSTMSLLLLFLLVTWCLVSMEQNHREQKRGNAWFLAMAVLAGGLTAVGGMTRYSFAWLILPVLGFLGMFFNQRRVLLAAAALGAFAVVMAPWLIRNYSVSGALFGTAGYAIYAETERLPGNRLERYLSNDLDEELAQAGAAAIARKFLVNAGTIIGNDLPKIGGSWVAGWFLVSLMIPFRNPALSRVRLFAVMSLLVLIPVQALGRTHLSSDVPDVNSENLLVLVTPIVVIFGSGLFFVLLDQIEFTFTPLRAISAVSFPLIACAPLILTLLPPRSYPVVWPPYFPLRLQEVGKWIERRELMMSDMPWAVAWYGQRKCVWTTLDAPSDSAQSGGSDFFTLFDFQKPISALYLTTLTSNGQIFPGGARSPAGAWGKFMLASIFKKDVPTGFPLKYASPDFIEDGQLFLADRPRWSRKSE